MENVMTKTTRRRHRTAHSSKVGTAGRIRLYLLMAITISIILTGFFFAARQHFESIDYSIRNSSLRRQLDDLENEKRRLIAARERSASPAEIRKAVSRVRTTPSINNDIHLATDIRRPDSDEKRAPFIQKTAIISPKAAEIIPAGYSVPQQRSKPSDNESKPETQPSKSR